MAYSNTQLFINGKWRPSHSGKTIDVLNPATEEIIGTVAHADKADPNSLFASVPVLRPGVYRARWTAVGGDGHRTHGDFSFTIK